MEETKKARKQNRKLQEYYLTMKASKQKGRIQPRR